MVRFLKSVMPLFLIRLVHNMIARYRFDIKIGPKSLVRGNCTFRGQNIIMSHSEVSHSRLGKYTYVAHHSILKFTDIGAYCSIGDHVRTCLGLHPVHFFSTHPQTYSKTPPSGDVWFSKSEFSEHRFLPPSNKFVVKIGNDVWIGNNVIIMDGVTIGDGAIVAAGSIVTKDVEPYAIVAGVPAKVIKKRFGEEKINVLSDLQWWNETDEWIKDNIDYLRSL